MRCNALQHQQGRYFRLGFSFLFCHLMCWYHVTHSWQGCLMDDNQQRAGILFSLNKSTPTFAATVYSNLTCPFYRSFPFFLHLLLAFLLLLLPFFPSLSKALPSLFEFSHLLNYTLITFSFIVSRPITIHSRPTWQTDAWRSPASRCKTLFSATSSSIRCDFVFHAFNWLSPVPPTTTQVPRQIRFHFSFFIRYHSLLEIVLREENWLDH